ncbi:MAG: hypothetical protein P4N59_03330 [Negativicutes bacterium]|nr:hypothetical protein [Negativicutes bacterium]
MAKAMFVWPYPNKKDLFSRVIQAVDGKDAPVHAVIVLKDSYVEALPQGTVQSPLGKYSDRPYEIYEVPVLHTECADAIAHLLIGRLYGWISCFAGWLRDRWGIKVPWVSTSFDDCSEDLLIWLRGQTLVQDLFGIESPMSITPKDLRDEIIRKGGILIEKNLR